MKTVSKSTLPSIDPKVRPLTQSPEHTNKQAEFLNHSVSSILIMVRERLNKKHLPLREGSRSQIG
jgi:hypothetical protein